ncbi:MAG: ribose 5-phosphate isomerase B [Chloroflexia bacterium]|nr:ribose 5-phosphate isomerase B [Chloroflexia bacterium]
MMQIAMAADHGGFVLKETLKAFLKELGHEVVDFGAYRQEPCDYPDFAIPAARAVADGECERGVFCCGTGLGVMLAANKVPGIRAVRCHEGYSARMSRRHNDANVLCLGGRVVGDELAREVVQVWLRAEFDGGRHSRRVQKFMELEKSA